MPRRHVRLQRPRPGDAARMAAALDAVETELDVPRDFSPEVLAAADAAAKSPRMPDLDRTDLPLVTLDPAGSTDLDQAVHIARSGRGYRVSYAIADVAAFVEPGGPIDVETHRRGQTLYAPDHRIPLHPPVLSEGAASLLPDQVRPALLWSIDLDSSGEGVRVNVERAQVRSRRQYSYEEADAQLTADQVDEPLALLREVGRLRQQRERDRGGVSLSLPDQEVVVGDRTWSLVFRQVRPVEDWNAQISLLTGMGAAEVMLYGEQGVVRTLPPATDESLARLRRTAAALRLSWSQDVDYPAFVRTLDPNTPSGAAMMNACASLFRGAGYVAFDGTVPTRVEHAALASAYAHVTAPLRRLVDRYAGEVAVALCAGRETPEWARRGLQDLPAAMQRSDLAAKKYERAIVDMVEAGTLKGRVGSTFTGDVVDLDDKNPRKGTIMLVDPAVEAPVTSQTRLPLGATVVVRLTEVNLLTRQVRFQLAQV